MMTAPTPNESMAQPNPKKTIWKVLLPVVVVLTLVLGALYAVKLTVRQQPSGQAVEMREGAVLPDFTLTVFGGGTKKFSELQAKVVLVNFWATWCEACMVELPSMIELRKAYHDKGFELVAINVDDKPESILPKTLKQFGIDFPIYLDPGSKLAELMDVSAIPLSVMLNKNRKVLLLHSGEYNWNSPDIRAKVEKWLAE